MHSPTLLIIMMAQMGLMAAVLVAVWHINRRVPGLKPWAFAYVLGFLACVEFAVRVRLALFPEVVSAMLAQGLLTGMAYLCLVGSRVHVGKPVLPAWGGPLVVSVVMLLIAYFTVIQPDLMARYVVNSTALGLLFLVSGRVLLGGGLRRYPARHVLALACLLHGGFLLIRPWVFSLGTPGVSSTLQIATVAPGILLETVTAQNLIALCVLLLASEHTSQALQQLVDRDALTGVLSRRAFLARLAAREVHVPDYSGRGMERALLIIDLDHFKQINDGWGHGVGDDALRHFVSVADACLREEDGLGRLGGEEFGVILPRTTHQQACAVAERLRATLASQPLLLGEASLRMTASIGITMVHPWDNSELALGRADQAMYQAKMAGRNRVASVLAASPAMPPQQLA